MAAVLQAVSTHPNFSCMLVYEKPLVSGKYNAKGGLYELVCMSKAKGDLRPGNMWQKERCQNSG